MNKILACIYSVTALILFTAGPCRAYENISSAILKTPANLEVYDYRVEKLEKFLEAYNSPLSVYAEDFVAFADEYDIDYRLVPAITGVESTFGKRIPANSFNAYGWANGAYSFRSWEDSIEVVTSTLRTRYVDRGANTIDKIGRIYAPPSKTWSGKVKFFVAKIDSLPVSFDI